MTDGGIYTYEVTDLCTELAPSASLEPMVLMPCGFTSTMQCASSYMVDRAATGAGGAEEGSCVGKCLKSCPMFSNANNWKVT